MKEECIKREVDSNAGRPNNRDLKRDLSVVYTEDAHLSGGRGMGEREEVKEEEAVGN